MIRILSPVRRFSSREGLASKTLMETFSEEKKEKKKEESSSVGFFVLFGALFGGFGYLARPTEESQSYFPSDLWNRAKDRVSAQFSTYEKPAFEKLLPDELPAPYQRPYTLIINFNDTLAHSEWTPEFGWRIAKNPDADMFLGYLSQFFEIVVFTSSQAGSVYPYLEKIDSYNSIIYKLYRDATTWEDGMCKKDLSGINRNLEKVIAIDVDEKVYPKHQQNLIILPKWDGKMENSTLKDYIPFLETLALSNVGDVRKVLKSYEGKEIPKEFEKRKSDFKRKKVPQTIFSALRPQNRDIFEQAQEIQKHFVSVVDKMKPEEVKVEPVMQKMTLWEFWVNSINQK